jgi:hypothetical protein
MLCNEFFELWHDVAVPAEREIRVDSFLERSEARFLQPGDLGFCPGLVREVRQRRSAPQRERGAEL